MTDFPTEARTDEIRGVTNPVESTLGSTIDLHLHVVHTVRPDVATSRSEDRGELHAGLTGEMSGYKVFALWICN